eukprot:259517_1
MTQPRTSNTTSLEFTNHQLITKKLVSTSYELHKQESSITNEDVNHILRIVEILGGMDCILGEYLCEQSNIHMTHHQLNQLNQLFVTPTNIKPRNNDGGLTQLMSLSHDEDHTKYNSMHCEFDPCYIYLYHLVGTTFAEQIQKIMHSTWPHLLFCLCVVGGVFIETNLQHHIIAPLYSLTFGGFGAMLYLSIWLLSVNKKGLTLIIQTFEFWIKCGYITLGMALILVNTYAYNNNVIGGSISDHKYLRLAADIMRSMNVILCVIVISMFDALQINRTAKILFSTIMATAVTFMCVYWEYRAYFNGRESVVFLSKSNNVSLSLLSIQQGMIEVIAVFSWKQAIFTMIRKGRCVLIKYSPTIEWKTNQTNDVSIPGAIDDTNDSKIIDTVKYIQDTPTVENRCTPTVDAADIRVMDANNNEGKHHDSSMEMSRSCSND